MLDQIFPIVTPSAVSGKDQLFYESDMNILLDIFALFLLYTGYFYKKWRTSGRRALLLNTLMYAYLSAVLFFTLMPILASLPFLFNHPYVPMNLIPFIDLIEGRGDFIRQIILNVAMTIPFGFLLPLTQRRNCGFFKTILFTFLLSAGIELLQPLINGARSSDVTDIITNTVGGAAGYVLFALSRPITCRLLRNLPPS